MKSYVHRTHPFDKTDIMDNANGGWCTLGDVTLHTRAREYVKKPYIAMDADTYTYVVTTNLFPPRGDCPVDRIVVC